MTENLNYVICGRQGIIDLSYATFTSIGDKKENEDYLLVGEDNKTIVFSLADGLSKYGGGGKAAKTACLSAVSSLLMSDDLEDNTALANTYKSAAEEIIAEKHGISYLNEIYSTLNLLYLYNGKAYGSHIGNTRTYVFRDKKITQKTGDHTQAAILAKAGIISEDELNTNHNRHILLRALGTDDDKPAFESLCPVKIKAGDDFLLCSDGVWEHLSDESIERALYRSCNPEQWISNMLEDIERTNGGNKDNMSAIAIHVNGVKNGF